MRLTLRRLRGGELLAGVGAVVLFVSLFLEWFGGPHMSGWSSLGWLVLALATLAVALATWLVAATAAGRPITQIVAADVLAATVAPIAVIALALRTLVFQPGVDGVVSVAYGAWIGLAGALALALGAWWALADERTGARESAYTPPPPRPAPPAHAS